MLMLLGKHTQQGHKVERYDLLCCIAHCYARCAEVILPKGQEEALMARKKYQRDTTREIAHSEVPRFDWSTHCCLRKEGCQASPRASNIEVRQESAQLPWSKQPRYRCL